MLCKCRDCRKDLLLAVMVWAIIGLVLGGILGNAYGQSCTPGSTSVSICSPGAIHNAYGSIDATWCSNTGDLEVWATTPAATFGYAFTGPTWEYRHVAYIKGQLCVGAPQVRHTSQMWFSSTGNPIPLRLQVPWATPGTSIYVQGFFKDYIDGAEAFTNALRVDVL